MRRGLKWVVLGGAVVGCATAVTGPRLGFYSRSHGPRTEAAPAAGGGAYDQQIATRFEAVRSEDQDLEYLDLLKRLEAVRAPDARPSFDPTRVDYYGAIRKSLELTSEEQEIFKRTGIVGVDHGQRYSMASAYLAIYRRDLPVLITADSILHAMHRSFDSILIELELGHFMPTVKKVLAETQVALRAEARAQVNDKKDAALQRSLEDLDLYLTVARNLIAGSSLERGCTQELVGDDPCPDEEGTDTVPGGSVIQSDLGQDKRVKEVLDAIGTEAPRAEMTMYGGRRMVDWSQFKPRGHYTKSPTLRRYFRTMMWLGRIDVGFNLAPPAQAFGRADVARELRDAALLVWLVRKAGQLESLTALDRAIGFLVGLSDNTTIAQVIAAAERAGARQAADLAKPDLIEALAGELRKGGAGGQRIRSQRGSRVPGGGPETPLPDVFQLFGQRFVVDSFITSKLVFDSILYKGKAVERPMPTGLEVMAALGNDEAVALAEPELRKWNHAANLLAARRVVEERPPALWNGTQYDIWLSALSKLDDVPEGTDFPEVMRSLAWSRKQLQTQLGSWAELRHDTILYVKQSYTMGIICEYPTGYVEPYPEFFARVALFAEQANARLAAVKVPGSARIASFLVRFATIVHKLEALARKELAAQPFDKDEKEFVKRTIRLDTHGGGGCGGPTILYTGWYPELIYDGKPESWEPTIADVHSGDGVLEAAVGDVNFLVAAIDSRGDRAAYVGPIYSYYEFTSPRRLTDEEWREQITAGKVPPRPEWVRAFQARPLERAIVPPK